VTLSVIVRLREGRYDAGGLDPAQPEWPPHPARLFCALTASTADEADREALRWLERLAPPEVWCGEARTSRTGGFVVTNKTGETGHQTWPGRTSAASSRTGALPDDDAYAISWPSAEPDDATLARLTRLAARVPYVGRSTSTAEVLVTAAEVRTRPTWACHVSVPIGTAGSVPVRVPRPGYLDELSVAYEREVRSWAVAPLVLAYAARRTTVELAQSAHPSPFGDILIWGFQRPSVAVGGDAAVLVADCLRKAVLSRVADPVPAQVSGHGADGRPHVAFLGLLDVGHDHADGHLLGVGVAVPTQMDTRDRKALLRGLLGAAAARPMNELRTHRERTLRLQYAPTGVRGLDPSRWTTHGGCRTWVTATPLMLDRFPANRNRPADVADAVAACVVNAGYPEPTHVEPLPGPAVMGGISRFRKNTMPERPRRPLVHCRITFDKPQRGPVLAGSLRYLGSGLFTPEEGLADAQR
jgi:CRISPR-associated protein Csb2